MERPIILKAHEVRGILDGRQTQCRRIIKPQPSLCDVGIHAPAAMQVEYQRKYSGLKCPFGQPGDRLWVRETFFHEPDDFDYSLSSFVPLQKGITLYRADSPDADTKEWKPSSHMPRKLSRILLEIVSVRVERMMDITEIDARANGFPITWDGKPYDPPPPEIDRWQGYGRYSFCLCPMIVDAAKLMGTTNLRDVWNANPWVWVVEFKRVTADE